MRFPLPWRDLLEVCIVEDPNAGQCHSDTQYTASALAVTVETRSERVRSFNGPSCTRTEEVRSKLELAVAQMHPAHCMCNANVKRM